MHPMHSTRILTVAVEQAVIELCHRALGARSTFGEAARSTLDQGKRGARDTLGATAGSFFIMMHTDFRKYKSPNLMYLELYNTQIFW